MNKPAKSYLTMINNRQRFLNFLGIAQRAGRIISGEDSLRKRIKAHQIKFLVVASDAGSVTDKKFHDKAASHRIPINDQFTKDELSHAIGNYRTVIGIADRGFVSRLIELNQKIKGQ